MLMRTDPFRDLDRLLQQMSGTPSRPAAMPMDAYRDHDTFLVQFDLPGVAPDAIGICNDLATAYRAAAEAAAPEDRILVFGSFVTVAEVMRARSGR